MKINDNKILVPDGNGGYKEVEVKIDAAIERDFVFEQFDQNVKLDIPWLNNEPENSKTAIICGAAPSIKNYYSAIKKQQKAGAIVYACNSAAQVLVKHGIIPDYQVVLDPLLITLSEYCPEAKGHLLSSFCQPELFKWSKNPILWHFDLEWVDKRLDTQQNDKKGVLIGGGISVTMSTLCIAYTKGHRKIKLYGVDSSYQDTYYANGKTLEEVGSQQLRVEVDFLGKTYKSTWDMKAQVDLFMKYAGGLQNLGVKLDVYGTGLLPDVWKATFRKQER